MVVRIFHKLIEMKFGADVMSRPSHAGGLHQTQAGFLRQRSCMEQAFIVMLIQGVRRDATPTAKKFLCILLLDIKKAFDSFEYPIILRTLQRRNYSAQWLEIFRKFLPGNRSRILGHSIEFCRGTPQGGAVSPLLCNLVMPHSFAYQSYYALTRFGPKTRALIPQR
jgi:hypothetical protein